MPRWFCKSLSIQRLCPAPTGLVEISPLPQGVALGWYVSPLQDCHPQAVSFTIHTPRPAETAGSRAQGKRTGGNRLVTGAQQYTLSQHLVFALCPFTLRPRTLSPHLVENLAAEVSPTKRRDEVFRRSVDDKA
jgi:hypothetical protein